MEKFIMPKNISTKERYIICPDIRCNGFENEIMQCSVTDGMIEISKDIALEKCPHIDKAKLVVFCYYGHPIESVVNSPTWIRSDCNHDNCYSSSFAKMANITNRIPLSKYKQFLKLKVL